MKILTALLTLACMTLSPGCDMMARFQTASAPPAPAPTPTTKPVVVGDSGYLGKTALKTDPTTGESASAVDSALAWSQRYAKVSEELAQTQDQKMELTQNNQTLMAKNATLQGELEAARKEVAEARKELADANQMLVDIRQEMDKWKSNVLGFRDEMRTADKAQIEALKKIIVLLGGDLHPAPTTQPAPKQVAGAKETPSETVR